jgi:hypothetical protein
LRGHAGSQQVAPVEQNAANLGVLPGTQAQGQHAGRLQPGIAIGFALEFLAYFGVVGRHKGAGAETRRDVEKPTTLSQSQQNEEVFMAHFVLENCMAQPKRLDRACRI